MRTSVTYQCTCHMLQEQIAASAQAPHIEHMRSTCLLSILKSFPTLNPTHLPARVQPKQCTSALFDILPSSNWPALPAHDYPACTSCRKALLRKADCKTLWRQAQYGAAESFQAGPA